MNVRMWLHKATQENFKTLVGYGYKFIGPTSGEMACGEYGEGKMSSPRQIFSYLSTYFKNKNFLKKKNLSALVTSGPTREYIDPVRYISNESSGKQGYEIALALSKFGIKTTLIAGPSVTNTHKGLKIKKVKTADQMLLEVKKLLPVDIAICAAAVSDFKPKFTNKNKLKKDEIGPIKLKKNIDILNYLGKNNKLRPKIVVGFSAETNDLIKNSMVKLREKYCDFIIANDVSKKNTGFNVDYNKVSFIDKKGKIETISRNKKSYIASIIVNKIVDIFLINDKNIN
jgi:phosphopantothenoylcysteine decarboxylase/phosphopantothenate--cysteine ligase